MTFCRDLYLSCLVSVLAVLPNAFSQEGAVERKDRPRRELFMVGEGRPDSLKRMSGAERDEVVRIQILLDEAGFAPG